MKGRYDAVMDLRTEPDVARTASWFAHRSRVAMLAALSDGRALPSGELARAADIRAPAASEHLRRLVQAGLLEVVAQGRHRYYRLASEGVGELMESLAALAPPPIPITRSQTRAVAELRFARTCYGHLAGLVGVSVTAALFTEGILRDAEGGCAITDKGRSWFRDVGIDLGAPRDKRALIRLCPVDWTERRPHLAGPLGKALLDQTLERGYVVRARALRTLRLTDRGRRWLRDQFGLDLDDGAVAGAASQPLSVLSKGA
jgi:DNA-binding transcriptional ArsR family regulator